MAIVLVRVDDRLIHGQVAVAWGSYLNIDRIVLVNDDVAHTEWKRALYADADAMGASISVLDMDGFARDVAQGAWQDEAVIVVVGTPRDARLLLEHGLDGGTYLLANRRKSGLFVVGGHVVVVGSHVVVGG